MESFWEPWAPEAPPRQPREPQGDDFFARGIGSFWGDLRSDLQDRFLEALGSFWEVFWSSGCHFWRPKLGPADVCFDCTGVYGSHMGPARKDPQTEPGTCFFPDPMRSRPRDDFGRPWVVFGIPLGGTLAHTGLQWGPSGEPGLPQGCIFSVFSPGPVSGPILGAGGSGGRLGGGSAR